MSVECVSKFSFISKAGTNVSVVPATQDLKDRLRSSRGPLKEGRRQFQFAPDRKTKQEQSFMIMSDQQPVAWFQINRRDYADEGKLITLLNIETLEGNNLGPLCPKIALDFVEKLAKEEDMDMVRLDRPLQPERTLPMLERYGYVSVRGYDPRKHFKGQKLG